MERLYSPIIIKNLKNKTTKRMSFNFSKNSEKIIIKQRNGLLSSNSNRNLINNNILNLTPKSFKSEDNIKKDIKALLKYNLLTNTELKSRLISIKNKRNASSKFNKLKKNIFMNISPIRKSQDEFNEFKYNTIFQGTKFANKTEKMYKDLRKIFYYNILPGKNENKYKFDKPKSYIDKDYKYSDGKENNSNINKYISKSLLSLTRSKRHNPNNVRKINQFMNSIDLINSKENKIYKDIVKKSLFQNIKFIIKKRKKPKNKNKIHKHQSPIPNTHRKKKNFKFLKHYKN